MRLAHAFLIVAFAFRFGKRIVRDLPMPPIAQSLHFLTRRVSLRGPDDPDGRAVMLMLDRRACAIISSRLSCRLRVDASPDSECPIIRVLDPQEFVMGSTLVRVITLGQEPKRTLRGAGVLLGRMAA